ncbi:MAG: hypothetical protein V4726_24750 [Verrucomicrobiota bacterium]
MKPSLPPLAALPFPPETMVAAGVVLVLLILFRTPLAIFLKKLFGFKSEKAVRDDWFDPAKAASELKLAQEAKFPADSAPNQPDAGGFTKTVHEAASPKNAKRFSRAEVLWVDAHHNENIHERLALEALGIRFTLARSTKMALGILGQRSYAAVISEFGRPPGSTEATVLLETLVERGDKTPFIFYAPPRALEPHLQAMIDEKLTFTSSPEDLFRFITKAALEAVPQTAAR